MKAIVLVLLVVVSVALVVYLRRASTADTDGGFVTTEQFAALASTLQTSGKFGSFWVVLVPETARADGYAANLQYSIEDGVFGVDWVLIAQRNIEDRERFLEYVRRGGATVQEKERNGVRYLRATGDADLIRIGKDLLQGVYGVTPNSKLQLITTGFEWRENLRATPNI